MSEAQRERTEKAHARAPSADLPAPPRQALFDERLRGLDQALSFHSDLQVIPRSQFQLSVQLLGDHHLPTHPNFHHGHRAPLLSLYFHIFIFHDSRTTLKKAAKHVSL